MVYTHWFQHVTLKLLTKTKKQCSLEFWFRYDCFYCKSDVKMEMTPAATARLSLSAFIHLEGILHRSCRLMTSCRREILSTSDVDSVIWAEKIDGCLLRSYAAAKRERAEPMESHNITSYRDILESGRDAGLLPSRSLKRVPPRPKESTPKPSE